VKVTKEQLQKMIKEELKNVLNDQNKKQQTTEKK
jgi:predicted component of type VI protein secretion system